MTKKKARPSCKRPDEIESLEKKQQKTSAKYKHYFKLVEKLENMEIILTSEDGISKYHN